MADTLGNIAFLDRDTKRLEDARKAYDETLSIGRKLAATDPDRYLSGMASTLMAIGIDGMSTGRMKRAAPTGRPWPRCANAHRPIPRV